MNNLIDQTELSERSESDPLYRYSWAITIDIAPYKLINGLRWRFLSKEHQRDYLEDLLNSQIITIRLLYGNNVATEYYFEETQRGNIHLHGMLYYMTVRQAHYLRDTIHSIAGYPNNSVNRVCYMTATEISPIYFENYMKKEICNTTPLGPPAKRGFAPDPVGT